MLHATYLLDTSGLLIRLRFSSTHDSRTCHLRDHVSTLCIYLRRPANLRNSGLRTHCEWNATRWPCPSRRSHDSPSDLVDGGTKGKALNLLHAWKDQLWQIGGEQSPPTPRLLHCNPKGEEEKEKRTDEDVEVAAVMQSRTLKSGGTLKGFSREGVYFRPTNEIYR